jgi:hypothetical protein
MIETGMIVSDQEGLQPQPRQMTSNDEKNFGVEKKKEKKKLLGRCGPNLKFLCDQIKI